MPSFEELGAAFEERRQQDEAAGWVRSGTCRLPNGRRGRAFERADGRVLVQVRNLSRYGDIGMDEFWLESIPGATASWRGRRLVIEGRKGA